jgi:predicted Zn-dependent protease
MPTSFARHVAVLAAASLLVGCAQNPATGAPIFSLVGAEQERAIGQQTAEHNLKLYGMYRPESVATRYVQNLCSKLWQTTERAADPVSCLVLDTPEFNAWATPGYVTVNRGLRPYMNSEAELAAVIAHESGHVVARHTAQGVSQEMLLGILATGALLAVASQTDDTATLQATSIGAGLGAKATAQAFNRQDEYQADVLGQRYMQRAGYDPREAISMMDNMAARDAYDRALAVAFNEGKVPQEGLLSGLFLSHPRTPDRRVKLLKNVNNQEPNGSVTLPAGVQPATTAADPQGRNRYLRSIDGVAYGPARRFGIAGRNYVAIPSQRFWWQLPQGFVLDYVPTDKPDEIGLWVGVHPQSQVRVSIETISYKAGLNVGVALQQIFPKAAQVERLALKQGEVTAYTVVTKPSAFGSSKLSRRIAIPLPDVDKMTLLSFTFPDEATLQREDAALLTSVQQSVYLTANAANQLQPLRVDVFTAQPGQTVASVAAKLPSGALQQEWFRALNSLAPNQNLVPGRLYKTVVDPNQS